MAWNKVWTKYIQRSSGIIYLVETIPITPAFFLGREEGEGEGGGERGVVVQENKGILQRLKEVFWKNGEEGEGERRRQEGS